MPGELGCRPFRGDTASGSDATCSHGHSLCFQRRPPEGRISGGRHSSSHWSLASAPRSCLWLTLAARPRAPSLWGSPAGAGPAPQTRALRADCGQDLSLPRPPGGRGLPPPPPEASVHPGSPQDWALRRGPRGSVAMEGGQGLGHFAPRPPPTPTRQHADATGASLGDFSTYGLVLFFLFFF